ncbi:MAG TPA: PqqD family protein [Candidatus Limnocylindrales bacterium]|nr:PqqD family protein [Candidatus Limnocylindrales bacterium]
MIHQTIDGETIIIDFDSGAYFSTDGVGSVIWEQIAQNASVNDIIHMLTQRYTGNCADIEQGVEQFLIELQRESLIAPLDDAPSVPHAAPAIPDPNLAARSAFQVPSLHKYTDLQDLLLLDPIHEVDEQGWPIRKEDHD